MENVAAEREMDRRSVEQKQQMDRGAAERGAATQPLLWLLSLCRQFCCLSARLMFCLSAGPFGRCFDSRRRAVVFLSAPNFALSFSEALPSDPHLISPLLCLIFTSTLSSAFLPIVLTSVWMHPPASRVGLLPRCRSTTASFFSAYTAQMWRHVPSCGEEV